jgi:UDP-GlcNAc:undecaprenyl-phosphate GlcNAc-1-phosphate transferase
MTYVPWLGGEEWGRRALWLVCLWPGVMLAMATGLLEDLVGLDGWTKGVGQVLAGLVAYWCGAARVETVAGWAAPEWLGVGLTVGWLVGAMHAMHLANGLAAGAPLGMAGGVVAAGLWGEADGVAAGAAPLAGALAGLLSGQVRAAKLLLGEGGSRAVGYLLGCYGLAWGQGGEAMERMGRLW